MFGIKEYLEYWCLLCVSNHIWNIMFNSGQQPRIPSFNKCLWSAYTEPSTFIRCQRLRNLEGRIESFFFIMCIKPGDHRLCCRNNLKMSVADHTPSVLHFYSTHSSWTVSLLCLLYVPSLIPLLLWQKVQPSWFFSLLLRDDACHFCSCLNSQ